MGILARMQREFSETQPELMDLPNQDEQALRNDLQHLARLNRTFGGKKAVETVFHKLADKTRSLLLIDLAAGYGDHGRNLLGLAQAGRHDVTIVAVDLQFQTLQIARQATPSSKKMFFVQADARQLPFRNKAADLAFCSLALHHFAENDALTVLQEMARVVRHLASHHLHHPRPDGPPRRAPLRAPRLHRRRNEIARPPRGLAQSQTNQVLLVSTGRPRPRRTRRGADWRACRLDPMMMAA